MDSPPRPSENGRVYPTHEGETIFPEHGRTFPTLKLQFTFLWFLLVLLAPYPLWLTFINASLAYEITIVLNLILTITLTIAAILCWHYIWRLSRMRNMPYTDQIKPTLNARLSHILILSTFDEPIELLLKTIQTAAEQTVAKSIVMVVGMEERTPERDMKKLIITKRFGNSFKGLTFSVHPFLTNGEIPGPSSSNNYAARAAVEYMIGKQILKVDEQTNEIDLDYTTVTICKPDTSFSNLYFANLTHAFLNEDPASRYHLCWQSPLFYNIVSDRHWFFTRVMDILRSFFIIGFLIGYNINATTVYSTSLRLLVKSKYFHPRYQMDDMMFTVVALNSTKNRIRIRRLDVPTFTTSTSATNFYSELCDWVNKASRQTNGAAEAFHYLSVKLFKFKFILPGISAFLAFLYFYVFVLCFSGLTQITTLLIQLASFGVPTISISASRPFQLWFNLPDAFPFQWILPSLILFTYLFVFSTAFAMNMIVRSALNRPEKVSPLQKIAHFLASQIILWAYSSMQCFSILSIALVGKTVYGYTDMEISEKTLCTTEKIRNIPFHRSAPSLSSGISESSCSSSDITLHLDSFHNSESNDITERSYLHRIFSGSVSSVSTSTGSAEALPQQEVKITNEVKSGTHDKISDPQAKLSVRNISETQKTFMPIELLEPTFLSNDVVISIDGKTIVEGSPLEEGMLHHLASVAENRLKGQSTRLNDTKGETHTALKLYQPIQNAEEEAVDSITKSDEQESVLTNISLSSLEIDIVANFHKSPQSLHKEPKNMTVQLLTKFSSKTGNQTVCTLPTNKQGYLKSELRAKTKENDNNVDISAPTLITDAVKDRYDNADAPKSLDILKFEELKNTQQQEGDKRIEVKLSDLLIKNNTREWNEKITTRALKTDQSVMDIGLPLAYTQKKETKMKQSFQTDVKLKTYTMHPNATKIKIREASTAKNPPSNHKNLTDLCCIRTKSKNEAILAVSVGQTDNGLIIHEPKTHSLSVNSYDEKETNVESIQNIHESQSFYHRIIEESISLLRKLDELLLIITRSSEGSADTNDISLLSGTKACELSEDSNYKKEMDVESIQNIHESLSFYRRIIEESLSSSSFLCCSTFGHETNASGTCPLKALDGNSSPVEMDVKTLSRNASRFAVPGVKSWNSDSSSQEANIKRFGTCLKAPCHREVPHVLLRGSGNCFFSHSGDVDECAVKDSRGTYQTGTFFNQTGFKSACIACRLNEGGNRDSNCPKMGTKFVPTEQNLTGSVLDDSKSPFDIKPAVLKLNPSKRLHWNLHTEEVLDHGDAMLYQPKYFSGRKITDPKKPVLNLKLESKLKIGQHGSSPSNMLETHTRPNSLT